MFSPSLPPGIEGPIQGTLNLSITEVSWSGRIHDVIFRIKFWGEETSGILLQSSAIYLSYNVKTNISALIKYLVDMNYLIIDVLDQQGLLIGQIRVHLKSIGKSTDNINFRGKFPIVIKDEGKTGYAVIEVKTRMNRPESEVLASFLQNELKTLNEYKLENTEQDITSKMNPKKIFVPKSSLNKIPKPKAPEIIPGREFSKHKIGDKNTPTFHIDHPYDNEDNPYDDKQMISKIIEKNETEEQKEGQKKESEKDEESTDEILLLSKLKLKIISVELINQESSPFIYIESFLYKNSSSQDNIPDSFTISSISKQENKYFFNHESLHNCKLSDMVRKKNVLNYNIQFSIISSSVSSSTLGTSEISWKELVDSPELKKTITLPIYSSNTIESGKIIIESFILRPQIKIEGELPSPGIFYLYVESIDRLEGKPNIYICYKSFPDNKRICTLVMWSYSNTPICHQMLMPCPETTKNRLKKSILVIEVWSKQSEHDILLGISKIKLEDLAGEITQSIFPRVAVDDFLPIINPSKGNEIGYIKICVAFGSSLQIQRLSVSHSLPHIQ